MKKRALASDAKCKTLERAVFDLTREAEYLREQKREIVNEKQQKILELQSYLQQKAGERLGVQFSKNLIERYQEVIDKQKR